MTDETQKENDTIAERLQKLEAALANTQGALVSLTCSLFGRVLSDSEIQGILDMVKGPTE